MIVSVVHVQDLVEMAQLSAGTLGYILYMYIAFLEVYYYTILIIEVCGNYSSIVYYTLLP